jgi:hypothetical protein
LKPFHGDGGNHCLVGAIDYSETGPRPVPGIFAKGVRLSDYYPA